jgi:hypothetical protein
MNVLVNIIAVNQKKKRKKSKGILRHERTEKAQRKFYRATSSLVCREILDVIL